MRASDINPTVRDVVYAVLSSSRTDPIGIVVPLTQIDVTSTTYRGTASLGAFTSQSLLTLNAASDGESIVATAQADPRVQTALPLQSGDGGLAPFIQSFTHPSAVQNTFEDGLGEWSRYSGQGADITLDTATAATGQNSLRLTQNAANGDFSALIYGQPFEAAANSVVAFDYKLPPGVPFNFFFRRNGGMHVVTFTDRAFKGPLSRRQQFCRRPGLLGQLAIRLFLFDHACQYADRQPGQFRQLDDPGRGLVEYQSGVSLASPQHLGGWLQLCPGHQFGNRAAVVRRYPVPCRGL